MEKEIDGILFSLVRFFVGGLSLSVKMIKEADVVYYNT